MNGSATNGGHHPL